MPRFLLSISFVLLFSCDGYSKLQGQALVDSLLKELPKAKEDTGKVNILYSLSWENYMVANYDTSLYYAEQSKALAEKLGFRKRTGDAYSVIGSAYHAQGNYPAALKNNVVALKIREEMGDKQRMAASYNNIGNIYQVLGNYPEALKKYFSALKINKETGYKEWIANNYTNIGTVYKNQSNYNDALKNHFAALKIREDIGNKSGIAMSYACIARTYTSQGNYQSALTNHFASLKIAEEIGDKQGIAESYLNIGDNYIRLNQAAKAKIWLQKALALSKEIGSKRLIEVSYQGFTEADSALGNYKGAFENYKMYILYKDSLYNEENTKKLTQTEMQYEFDKKEAVAKAEQDKKNALAKVKLQRQQTYTYAGIGGVLLLLGFSFFIVKERKKSDKLLLNILPLEVAKELKAKGESDARLFDDVTVLFTDFVGFTTVSERLTPKQLVDELHTCFTAFDGIMAKHKIEKIKTVGDAYLAVSGLPLADEQHAENVVSAAIEIRDFMLARKQELGDIGFNIRIGVHSGNVVAGIVGVKKFAYDIWGDTVNTAARMEQKSEAGKINISQTTYELVKDRYTCTYRGEIEAKNKGMMKMYFVEGSLISEMPYP
jgi:adenylate cyclase